MNNNDEKSHLFRCIEHPDIMVERERRAEEFQHRAAAEFERCGENTSIQLVDCIKEKRSYQKCEENKKRQHTAEEFRDVLEKIGR